MRERPRSDRRRGTGARLRDLTVAIGAGVALLASPARAASVPGPDSSRVRVEIGPGFDLTNEIYYEDAFVDTTFLGRQVVTTPETRVAGVLFTAFQGTRAERATSYLLQNELSLGDKVQRDALSLGWRQDLTPDWRLLFDPSLEWRHDQTFDRDQQEWRGGLRGRIRRTFDDDATSFEVGAGGDVVRTSGLGSQFLLDRNAVRGTLVLDHLPLFGEEWRVGYSLTDRVFPDSSERDHVEHGWEGRWRHPFTGGSAITLETTGQRRQTHELVYTSRDNFWGETGALDAEAHLTDRWSLKLRLDGEALQYDLEDSTVFFNYHVVRGKIGARFEREARWSLTAGPTGEVLTSPLAPGESYREIGGEIELEVLGGQSWWNVTPEAGYRSYDQSEQPGLPGALHSSFAYVALDAFVDQALPAHLRLRGLTSLRYESHTDPAQDAASIYLSLQLRWIAR